MYGSSYFFKPWQALCNMNVNKWNRWWSIEICLIIMVVSFQTGSTNAEINLSLLNGFGCRSPVLMFVELAGTISRTSAPWKSNTGGLLCWPLLAVSLGVRSDGVRDHKKKWFQCPWQNIWRSVFLCIFGVIWCLVQTCLGPHDACRFSEKCVFLSVFWPYLLLWSLHVVHMWTVMICIICTSPTKQV